MLVEITVSVLEARPRGPAAAQHLLVHYPVLVYGWGFLDCDRIGLDSDSLAGELVVTCREQEPAPHLLSSREGADGDLDPRFERQGLSTPHRQSGSPMRKPDYAVLSSASGSAQSYGRQPQAQRDALCAFPGVMPKRASSRQNSVRDRAIPPLAMITAGKTRLGELWPEAAATMIDCCADHTDIGRWASRLGRKALFID
ncbi:hypothetical protein BDW67DRAFT_155767 [Aspergillus spinulosporus]